LNLNFFTVGQAKNADVKNWSKLHKTIDMCWKMCSTWFDFHSWIQKSSHSMWQRNKY